MRVLLTNDDGIHAPGLQALEQAVLQLGWQRVIVAPAQEQSMWATVTHGHPKPL